jgi:hypothetical protein
MKTRLLILLAVALGLTKTSSADQFDQLGQTRITFKATGGSGTGGPVPNCGDDKNPCKCQGPNGRQKFFHFILYQQNGVVGSNFTNDIQTNAGVALRVHNVELIKPPENDQGNGGHQLFSYPKEADCARQSAEDKKANPLCVIAVEDQIALCQVVRDAFKAHAPPASYLPIFYVWFGGSLKKQIGTDVAGQFYPPGSFKSRCAVVAEDDGIPNTAFAVIDVKPDVEAKQVLIHEMGHATGESVGKKDWFQDLYPGENAPADIKNIMVSRKSLTDWKDLQMSPFQVQALCQSPYVSNNP